MKLIKTYKTDGTHEGYFDPLSRCRYGLFSPGRRAEEPQRWMVDVSEGELLHQFLSPPFATRKEALTELDRIAALIEGKASAQGWVAGPPPQDGKTYVVAYDHDEMQPGVARWVDGEFEDDSGQHYGDIRYHLPTPIQLPKES